MKERVQCPCCKTPTCKMRKSRDTWWCSTCFYYIDGKGETVQPSERIPVEHDYLL